MSSPRRLFLAVWPDAATMAVLSGVDRPPRPGLRWTRPDQWHVTLRFVGDADPEAVAGPLDAVLAGAGPGPRGGAPEPPLARLGPATGLLGRHVLQVPVEGLAGLAQVVTGATRQVGEPPDAGPFRGHLTLARARRPRDLAGLAGSPVSSSWPVDELTLVSSSHGRPGGRPGRYEVLRRWSLDRPHQVP